MVRGRVDWRCPDPGCGEGYGGIVWNPKWEWDHEADLNIAQCPHCYEECIYIGGDPQ